MGNSDCGTTYTYPASRVDYNESQTRQNQARAPYCLRLFLLSWIIFRSVSSPTIHILKDEESPYGHYPLNILMPSCL